MFVDEFFFSFSLLVFTAMLFILGTAILLDAFRRLFKEWWKKSSRQKDTDIVPVVEIEKRSR